MKAIRDTTTTKTIHRRVIVLENGPIMSAGGLHPRGLEFTVDSIIYEHEDGQGVNAITLLGWTVGPVRERLTRITLPANLPQRLLDFITNPKEGHHDD